jgi:hypothetical protein
MALLPDFSNLLPGLTKSPSNKLKQFIAEVKNGGVMKNSRYSVFMPPPKGLSSEVNLRKLLLFCSEAQLPAVNLSTFQIRTYGEIREAPYEKLFDNVNLTFYVDQAMEVKLYFDRWMYLIQNGMTRTFEYYDNYVTDLDIYVEDARDDSRYVVTLRECYPKTINAVNVSYDSKTEMKLQVSFNYKYWESTTLAASGKAEPGPWDFLSKLPTINGNPAGQFFTDFGGFQSTFNKTFPETQNVTSGVTSIFTGQ